MMTFEQHKRWNTPESFGEINTIKSNILHMRSSMSDFS